MVKFAKREDLRISLSPWFRKPRRSPASGSSYHSSASALATLVSACKCYDIEVWLPSYNVYKEISSALTAGISRARRANIRYMIQQSSWAPVCLHTLNGSGLLVVPMVAIMENYQERRWLLPMCPEALRPYMGGTRLFDQNISSKLI